MNIPLIDIFGLKKDCLVHNMLKKITFYFPVLQSLEVQEQNTRKNISVASAR